MIAISETNRKFTKITKCLERSIGVPPTLCGPKRASMPKTATVRPPCAVCHGRVSLILNTLLYLF